MPWRTLTAFINQDAGTGAVFDRPRPSSSPQPRPRSPSPEEVAGLCFRCLDHRHRVRDCTNDVWCRRCLVSGHESSSCVAYRRDAARRPRTPRGNASPASIDLPRPQAALTPVPPPATLMAPVRVIVSQSMEMEEAELVLFRAMGASITGNRPSVSAAEVAAVLLDSLELVDGDFTIHAHHPEDFLILFSS